MDIHPRTSRVRRRRNGFGQERGDRQFSVVLLSIDRLAAQFALERFPSQGVGGRFGEPRRDGDVGPAGGLLACVEA